MEYVEYEEQGEYEPPVPTCRATVGHDYTASVPKVSEKPREKPQRHFLFSAGVGMCIVILLLFIWNVVVSPFIHNMQLQWHYGDNRVSMMGADVGHGGVSRFIAFDGENEIVIVEVVSKKYMVYTIPTGKLQNQLVTLSLKDVNGDGKVDLIVTVDGQEGSFVLYNTGSSFQSNQ